MADVLDLPFDQYQRYELVRALLESVRSPGETFQVLDVGGRTALLREFLPADRVELVDVDPSDVDGLILGSGAELPFQSDSVDVVAAFDTLEHVPPALRDAFVAECARVARRYVILAGPYDSPRVAEAEEILLAFLRDRLDWTHRYLEEHRINGLPDAGATRAVLEASGAKVEMLGHGALDRWLLLMCLELYAEHEPMLRELAGRAYRLYNEHLFRSDHGDDVYRHAMVAVFGDAPVPHLRDALDAPGSAPAGATEVFRELGQELMRYDALRDSYAPEMERLHGVVAGLEKDRDEHAESLAVQTKDLEESRKTITTIERDLTETRKSYETVQADLEGSRETIEALRAEAERERERSRRSSPSGRHSSAGCRHSSAAYRRISTGTGRPSPSSSRCGRASSRSSRTAPSSSRRPTRGSPYRTRRSARSTTGSMPPSSAPVTGSACARRSTPPTARPNACAWGSRPRSPKQNRPSNDARSWTPRSSPSRRNCPSWSSSGIDA